MERLLASWATELSAIAETRAVARRRAHLAAIREAALGSSERAGTRAWLPSAWRSLTRGPGAPIADCVPAC